MQYQIFLISNFRRVLNVVCFLLGDSPASEFYMPTFRNTLFHLHRHLPAYEDGTECSETSAYKIQTSGNHPKESIQYQIFPKQLISQEYFFFNKMKSITVNYVDICVSNELPREGEQPAAGEKAKDSIWTVAQFSHATDSILNP